MKQYFVVDYKDDFVLYKGTQEQCEQVLEENYAGLSVVGYRDLTPGMISSIKNKPNPPKEKISYEHIF